MEDWELDFKWLRLRHFIKDRFRKSELPDLDALLFLIGVQELGQLRQTFTKEEKQDLIHISVCRLLSTDGYYTFDGLDTEGWPHWQRTGQLPFQGVHEQASYLKEKIIAYFADILEEEE